MKLPVATHSYRVAEVLSLFVELLVEVFQSGKNCLPSDRLFGRADRTAARGEQRVGVLWIRDQGRVNCRQSRLAKEFEGQRSPKLKFVQAIAVLNRTGFLGDLIAWEDGVYGTSKSVFSGGA